MRRIGVSKVTVTVVLLVLGVGLAYLVYEAARGTVFHVAQSAEASSPRTNLEIIGFSPNNPNNGYAEIDIKNKGPSDIPAGETSSWQVFINGTECQVTLVRESQADGTFKVEEVLTLRVMVSTRELTGPQSIRVYGPGGSRAYAGWSPGQGEGG